MSNADNIVEFPDLKVIEEEAALWVARLDSRGALSSQDEAALSQWLSASALHRDAFEQMALLWHGGDILDELNYQDEDSDAPAEKAASGARKWWISTAAAAAVLFISAFTIFQAWDGGPAMHTGHYVTLVGEQQTIGLADGSSLILNTNSEVRVDYTEDTRSITLLRGEAHFDVAHEPERPFLVYARDGIVKAVGTAFTVLLHDRKVEVTVSEGVVALLARPSPQDVSPETIVPDEDLAPLAALTVGESAVFAEAVESVTRMSEEALDRKLLWRGGFLAFAGEPLATVVADVSRYTDIQIEIDDPALEALPIGGYFRVGEVEDMFESLEASFGIRVQRINPSKVVLAPAS